jgi:hypothetical protein
LFTYLTSPILVLKYNKSEKNSILKAVKIIISRKKIFKIKDKKTSLVLKIIDSLRLLANEYKNSILTALFMIKMNNFLLIDPIY